MFEGACAALYNNAVFKGWSTTGSGSERVSPSPAWLDLTLFFEQNPMSYLVLDIEELNGLPFQLLQPFMTRTIR